jgi:uracil phosphoribosyltransferase
MINVYEAVKTRSLVREFYEKAWRTTEESRRIFEQIGWELTEYALNNIPLLRERRMKSIENVYAAPIARAGFGLLRPSTTNVLKKTFQKLNMPFETFGLGLSRSHPPDKLPAEVYWNTLRNRGKTPDLSSSLILIYDMGEATGSTIEGVIRELAKFKFESANLLVLVGAAGIEQTRSRLAPLAPGMSFVIGSQWRYETIPGPTQFYLNQMFDGEWIPLEPKDWGRCVSGMTDKPAVQAFITWIDETVPVSKADKAMLYQLWVQKVDERKITI